MITEDVLEVHLEELGQHSWWRAMLNTLARDLRGAQVVTVLRPVAGRRTRTAVGR